MERRTLLAAASVGALAGGPLARLANAQRDSGSFKTAEIEVENPVTLSTTAIIDLVVR